MRFSRMVFYVGKRKVGLGSKFAHFWQQTPDINS